MKCDGGVPCVGKEGRAVRRLSPCSAFCHVPLEAMSAPALGQSLQFIISRSTRGPHFWIRSLRFREVLWPAPDHSELGLGSTGP